MNILCFPLLFDSSTEKVKRGTKVRKRSKDEKDESPFIYKGKYAYVQKIQSQSQFKNNDRMYNKNPSHVKNLY